MVYFPTVKLIVGVKQTLRALNENILECIFIAEDADGYAVKQVIEAAKEMHLQIINVESKKKLGKQCGIDIGAACAGRPKQ